MPQQQQSQNMAKSLKILHFDLASPQGRVMSLNIEQPLDE